MIFFVNLQWGCKIFLAVPLKSFKLCIAILERIWYIFFVSIPTLSNFYLIFCLVSLNLLLHFMWHNLKKFVFFGDNILILPGWLFCTNFLYLFNTVYIVVQNFFFKSRRFWTMSFGWRVKICPWADFSVKIWGWRSRNLITIVLYETCILIHRI